MNPGFGKILMFGGAMLLLAGIVIYFFGDKFNWLGNLPGDIRIEKENTRVYIPVTTMILISLLLTLIINIIRKLL